MIPYLVEGGELRLLLISSRDTHRWVIPRGRVERRFGQLGTATQEAFEEAGIIGEVGSTPLGCYTYFKRAADGTDTPAVVRVFPCKVVEQLADWPEKESRSQEWVTVDRAVRMVREKGLARLFRRLQQMLLGGRAHPNEPS